MTKIIPVGQNDTKYITLWDAFADEHDLPPQAYFRWKTHLEDVYGLRTIALVALDGEDKAVGFALIYFKAGDETAYSCRYGFYAENQDTAELLENEITKICSPNNVRSAIITSGSLDTNLHGRQKERDSLYIPLQYPDENALWESVPKKTKNMIRKAEKSGFTVSDDWKNLEHFYVIYTERFLEKSLNIKTLKHFQSVKSLFGENTVLLTAFQNGKPAAGMIFIASQKIVSYAYNASVVSAANNGANNLLMWEAMKRFQAQGQHFIDLSESQIDSPVYKFKTHLSKDIQPRKIFYYDILKDRTDIKKKTALRQFIRHKINGILHRLFPVMPVWAKKKYLLHLSQRGRVI